MLRNAELYRLQRLCIPCPLHLDKRWHQPESAGLNAIAEGFRHLGFSDDRTLNASEWIVYDALYAYCCEMVRKGRPEGAFR